MLMSLLWYIYSFNLPFKWALVEDKIHGSFKIDFFEFSYAVIYTDNWIHFQVLIAYKALRYYQHQKLSNVYWYTHFFVLLSSSEAIQILKDQIWYTFFMCII